MGVVKKRGTWWVDFRYECKRHRRKIGPSKAMADKVWAKIQTDIAENRFLDVKRTQMVKFEVFAEEYYENHCKVNHRSVERSAGGRVKSLLSFFKGRYLHEITPLDIEKFKSKRIKEIKPSTANRELACLKAMFYKAIQWKRYNGSNPVKEVKFFKEDNNRLRYLEKEEIDKLVTVSSGTMRAIIILALNTGMRRGEIFNLKWHDIDFSQGIIYLLQTKSGNKRMVPMNDFLKNTLIGVRKNPNSAHIFCSRKGEQYKDIRTPFKTVLSRANIKNFRFHDLRHTFASHLVMAGVDLNTVRELLGHADLKTTLIYAHLSQDHKKRAVNVLSQYLGTFSTKDPKPAIQTKSLELVAI